MYVKNMQGPTLIFSEEKSATELVNLPHILPDWLAGCNFGRGRPNTLFDKFSRTPEILKSFFKIHLWHFVDNHDLCQVSGMSRKHCQPGG